VLNCVNACTIVRCTSRSFDRGMPRTSLAPGAGLAVPAKTGRYNSRMSGFLIIMLIIAVLWAGSAIMKRINKP
jgi:hypothetical protein